MGSIKYVFGYMKDSFYRILLLFELSSKKDEDYIYQRDFLGEKDYWKDLSAVFKPVTEVLKDDFERIYSIKETSYNRLVYEKIKYCIKNKFWGIFAFTGSDENLKGNSDYFNLPSIRVYLIVKRNEELIIVIVKTKVRQFEILDWYTQIKTSLNTFRDKRLIYSIDKNFISL